MNNRQAKATEPNKGAGRVSAPDEGLESEDFLAAVQRLAKPRPHLPADYALNHGRYVFGEPKK